MRKAITFKDSVTTYAALPIVGNAEGDVRMLMDTGEQYYWFSSNSTDSIHNWRLLNAVSPTMYEHDKFNLELEMAYNAAAKNYFKELVYTLDVLTAVNIWVDSSKTQQLFTKTFEYASGQLIKVSLTRISDSATLVKTLTYVDGDLLSVDII